MKKGLLPTSVALACAVLLPRALAAEPSYGEQLASVYGAYQRILTLRDACNSARPRQKAATDQAFAAWKARNQKVLDEIDAHVATLLRSKSGNAKEYAINVGKFEGERLQEREERKQQFLSLSQPQLDELCLEFPKTLANGGTDLEAAYADELKSIRSRR